jgi:hypothetical protein
VRHGGVSAQGIEAEIPQASGDGAEELERKARSPPQAGMRPKFVVFILIAASPE